MDLPFSQTGGRRTASSRWLGAILLGLLAVTAVRAASPRDELLRFVPEQTAFCVIFQDLRTHWHAVNDSPFAAEFRRSLGQSLQTTEELDKLKKLEKDLEKQFGLDWGQVRDDIFGEAMVFAFRAGPPGQPREDRGLFLLRAHRQSTWRPH